VVTRKKCPGEKTRGDDDKEATINLNSPKEVCGSANERGLRPIKNKKGKTMRE